MKLIRVAHRLAAGPVSGKHRQWTEMQLAAGKMNTLTMASSKSSGSKASSATQSTATAFARAASSKPSARAAAKKATSYVDLVDRFVLSKDWNKLYSAGRTPSKAVQSGKL